MAFEVARARQLLEDGLPLVAEMPWPMRIDIDLFARGGLCLLDRIERIGYRVWQNRPVLTKIDFGRLFFGSLGRGLFRLPRRPAI
jgi:phytoene/squalene synthetase